MARRRGARRPTRSNTISAIVGGVLLMIGFLWLISMIPAQHGGMPNFSLPGFNMPASTPETQITQLLAQGVVLGHSDQTPSLSQKQALLLAGQLEPDAATKAKNITAKYVLLTYTNPGTTGAHPNLNNVPVWMIWYQQIPLIPADAAVDPTPFPHSYHDLFVFLDANSGKEVLSVWA